MKWITHLYKLPQVAIKVGYMVSSLFYTTWYLPRLSPAVFGLMMEPIAVALCTNPNIKGLILHSLEKKVAMYADDVEL